MDNQTGKWSNKQASRERYASGQVVQEKVGRQQVSRKCLKLLEGVWAGKWGGYHRQVRVGRRRPLRRQLNEQVHKLRVQTLHLRVCHNADIRIHIHYLQKMAYGSVKFGRKVSDIRIHSGYKSVTSQCHGSDWLFSLCLRGGSNKMHS